MTPPHCVLPTHRSLLRRQQQKIHGIGAGNKSSSTEVAKIKEDFLGNPTVIVDKKGQKIGNIKTDWLGDKIIVDKDGNKIGEYKRGKK